jgi:hypothetical protein
VTRAARRTVNKLALALTPGLGLGLGLASGFWLLPSIMPSGFFFFRSSFSSPSCFLLLASLPLPQKALLRRRVFSAVQGGGGGTHRTCLRLAFCEQEQAVAAQQPVSIPALRRAGATKGRCPCAAGLRKRRRPRGAVLLLRSSPTALLATPALAENRTGLLAVRPLIWAAGALAIRPEMHSSSAQCSGWRAAQRSSPFFILTCLNQP